MNPMIISSAVDLLALYLQTSSAAATYSSILTAMHSDGRTTLTPEEQARVDTALLASEERLRAATAS